MNEKAPTGQRWVGNNVVSDAAVILAAKSVRLQQPLLRRRLQPRLHATSDLPENAGSYLNDRCCFMPLLHELMVHVQLLTVHVQQLV
jgi:hypothetical protein